jgi:hypothetical protein
MTYDFEHELYAAIVEAVQCIRGRLGKANISSFVFSVGASGQTDTGENNVLITYNLDGTYEDRNVEGESISAVVDELVRRRDWKRQHRPLKLTHEG